MTIPAFVNPNAGNGEKALAALAASGAYQVTQAAPDVLADRLRLATRTAHAERLLVAGGDGTVAAAAAIVASTPTELAVLPAGTLNHFARDHGIPTDLSEAAAVGATGRVITTDVAYVNDRLFLNTSSVGAYVQFVRTRGRLERHIGYPLASVVAALRLLGRVHPFAVELDTGGETRRYRTSLVFIGVGERELRIPTLGGRVSEGRRGLHVMIVRGGTAARLVAAGLMAVARGLRAVRRDELVDSFVVDRCRIELRRPNGTVAVDGELVPMRAPLEYRVERDALRLVVPAALDPTAADRAARR